MRPFLREPLLHFLALGVLLFALYGWLNPDPLQSPDQVVVDQARAEALAGQFRRVWQRSPTRDELQGLIDGWVREEVLYREGLSVGMDRDDEVVRRRVVLKMNFLTEDMAADVPEEAELEAWLRQHPDDYRIEPSYTLRQVYFDPGRHGERLKQAIAAARAALEDDPRTAVGDATLLPAKLENASVGEVARVFGTRFAESLAPLPDGGWSGPVPSEFGLHLVRIEARTPARLPTLAEVRQAVERDLLTARTRQASDTFYQALRQRYTVTVQADLEQAVAGLSAARSATPAGAGTQ